MSTSNRRTRTKHPELNKNLHLKIRQELIDYDYLDKLNEEEKEWLNRFTKEYVSASFEKTKKGNPSPKNLHKGSKLRKKVYNANNKRNIDAYAISRINNSLAELTEGHKALDTNTGLTASLI